MRVVTGRQNELPDGLYSKIAHYRHKVFVERLGWQLQTFGNEEQDQFDRLDTVYIISHDELGNISGCGRLLPTTRPYLLGDVFPQVLNGMAPPNSPDVWELSRFATVDFNAKPSCTPGQFSSPLTVKFLREVIAVAAAQGAKRVITVSPLGVERLLKRIGFHTHQAAPPIKVNGYPVFACWIETDDL